MLSAVQPSSAETMTHRLARYLASNLLLRVTEQQLLLAAAHGVPCMISKEPTWNRDSRRCYQQAWAQL